MGERGPKSQNFPVSREFDLESGSLETPPTAIESLKSAIYCKVTNEARDFGQISGFVRGMGTRENSLLAQIARDSHQFSKPEFRGSLLILTGARR
jgi:hypothetical protein